MNIYDFKVKDAEGNLVSMEKYRGKTLLIVNTAISCFFTPQYQSLQKLYDEMQERDFVILVLQCNQFGHQAGDSQDERCCCRNRFSVTFDQFSLVDVNGENADPLFKYLKQETKFEGFGLNHDAFKAHSFYRKIKKTIENQSSDIRWNFTKFLVDKDGEVVARFESSEPIEIIRGEVNRLLNGEELSRKKILRRTSKDKNSKVEKKLKRSRIRASFMFFILTYLIIFLFDLVLLQRNGFSVFSEQVMHPSYLFEVDQNKDPSSSKNSQDNQDTEIITDNETYLPESTDDDITITVGEVTWIDRIIMVFFNDTGIVKNQLLLPLPSAILLTLAFELLTRKNNRQVNRLCNALEQAGAGNFNYRLKTLDKDIFSKAFIDYNSMNRKLKKSMKELEEAVIEAKSASEAKSNFLSNMSHEIRTPLNAVLGMDEMILRESQDETILAYANDIHLAGKTLLSLINDILDFSKIEANKMTINPVEYDLSSVINDLVNMTSDKAKAKGLTLTIDVDETMPHILEGDEIRVKQVCLNILNNAIKYTETGSVNVSFKKAEIKGQNALRFICQDTGQGIREEDIPKLTEPFARIDEKKNRSIEGTGLGMSITTNLLSLMGSKLELESTFGQGSTFSFTILQPALSDEEMGDFSERYKHLLENQKKYVESFHAPDARILIVDDVEMNLTVARSFLKKTQIKVDTCTSGRDALKLAKVNAYHIIFVDHMMPDMDGFETLAAIRESDEIRKDTPVIVLTANAVSGAREKYLNAGFNDYLTKPIDGLKLEKTIAKYLPENLLNKVTEDEMPVADEDADLLNKKSAISEIDGLDVEEGIKNSGGLDAYISVVENFGNTAMGRATDIDEFLQNNDLKNYTIQVHALKSSARLVGHMELSELAKELEACGNSGDISTITSKTPELLDSYMALADSIKAIFAERKDLPLIEADMLKDAITTLYECLSVFDMDTADDIMATLSDYSMPDSFNEIYDSIKVMMSNVDRDGIMNIIEGNKEYWG